MKTKELKLVAIKVRLLGRRRIIKHKVNTADEPVVVNYRDDFISFEQGEKTIALYKKNAVKSIEFVRKMA